MGDTGKVAGEGGFITGQTIHVNDGPANTDNGADRQVITAQHDDAPSVGACLAELLDQLRIATAHFAGRGSADLKGFLAQHLERVASLTVLCPAVLDTRTLAVLGERLLVVTGDRGPGARRVRAGLPVCRRGPRWCSTITPD